MEIMMALSMRKTAASLVVFAPMSGYMKPLDKTPDPAGLTAFDEELLSGTAELASEGTSPVTSCPKSVIRSGRGSLVSKLGGSVAVLVRQSQSVRYLQKSLCIDFVGPSNLVNR